MFCPNCGSQVDDNAKFCNLCGSHIVINDSNLSDTKQDTDNIRTQPVPLQQSDRHDTFIDCYKSFWQNYFNFSGRTTRREYWCVVLANIIVSLILSFIDLLLFGSQSGVLTHIYAIAGIIPSLAIVWRRLHDIDKSGGFYFLIFIPFIGWIILLYFMCKKGTYGPNRYGSL